MQDDLLQCSCKSPKGGRAGTNTLALPRGAERVLGGRRHTGVGTLILETLLLGIINAAFGHC